MSQTNANIFSNDDIYTELVPPHGSPVLKPLALVGDELTKAISTAKTLPKSPCHLVSVAIWLC